MAAGRLWGPRHRLQAGRELAVDWLCLCPIAASDDHDRQLPSAAALTMSATCVAEMTAPAVILSARRVVVTWGRVEMNHSTRTSMNVPAGLGHSAGLASWNEGEKVQEGAAPRVPGGIGESLPVEPGGGCVYAWAHSR